MMARRTRARAALAWLALAPLFAQLAPKPAPLRPEWRGLIGEYGRGKDVLYVLEKGGKLAGLIEGRGYFDNLTFVRDGHGRAAEARLGGVAYERRPVRSRIQPLRPVAELRRIALAAKLPAETGVFRKPDLVDLPSLDPTIRLDIRYATTNNFLGTPFYTQARARLQRPAAEALVRANRRLRDLGYGLLIHDAYRPWYVTKMFWDATPGEQKIFVADPAKGSRHNRGCAVDLTLYDRHTGQPVEMPSAYDEMSARAYPNFPGGTALARWDRDLLRRTMEAEGFTVYEYEWWHFDYKDWPHYPILNQQ